MFAPKSNGSGYSSLKTTDDKVYKDKIWRRDDGNKSPAGVKSSHSQALMKGGSGDVGRNKHACEHGSGTDREGVGSHLQRSEHQDGLPGELPVGFEDKWNKKYVRMPCSPSNVTRDRISRWDMICSALTPRCGFHDVKSLIRAITSYTPCKTVDSNKWSFRALESLVNDWYDSKERARFFQTILPFIIKSALMLPKHCPRPIRLLLAGKSDCVNLSALQIVSLLANAFLCTFPEDKELLGRSFGRINFCMLFEAPQRDRHPNPVAQHIQKLLCILNYFERQGQRSEAELAHSCVSFHRRSHQQGRDWAQSSTCIDNSKLKVDSTGTIEDLDPTGANWEVDFANSIVGGGVLGSGCVQEEIRFLLSPELIASRLLTERLGDLEGVLITGSERFSKYTGYASSFKFHGDHVDPASKDTVETTDSNTLFLRKTTITAMDAIHFSNSEYTSQFRPKAVQRELNKAFVSFQAREALDDGAHVIGGKHAPWVATGNWGCGVFGGDSILKAVIQIMAAAEAGRNIHYLTFGNDVLAKQILQVYGVLCNGNNGRSLTVGQLWGALEKFRLSTARLAAPNGGQELLAFVLDLQWLKSGPADVIEVKDSCVSEEEERETDFHEKASEKQSTIEMRKGKKRESLSPQEVLDSEEEKT
jgi:poly(ADP-ribose) glycohydrolase